MIFHNITLEIILSCISHELQAIEVVRLEQILNKCASIFL